MRYFIIMLLLLSTMQAQAGGVSNQIQIQQQLKATPEMDERCISNIDYYDKKITKYELKVHLNSYQKQVLKYYQSEKEAWNEYCNGFGDDPDFR